jgi:cobalamin biosynthesis Mg chelatase CobN
MCHSLRYTKNVPQENWYASCYVNIKNNMRKLTLILGLAIFTLTGTTLKAQNSGTVESKQNSGSTGGDVGPTVVDTPKKNGAVTKPYSATNSGAVSKAQASALNSPITSNSTTTQNTTKTPATSTTTGASTTTTNTPSTATNANNTDSTVTIDSTNSTTAAANTYNNDVCPSLCKWGWLGLLGLIGLFGLLGKRNKA